jgi:hypothetical protein
MSLPSGYNRWCRRYRPPAEHAAARLVCFPHAGGPAPFYLPMAAALSPGVDVAAIQYPGRQERRAERPIADLMVLADRSCDVLRGQPEMPMTFFGHSMGALVGFEVARRLEADNWDDWAAVLTPWGCDLAATRVPVRLWHGARDQAVPIAHGARSCPRSSAGSRSWQRQPSSGRETRSARAAPPGSRG